MKAKITSWILVFAVAASPFVFSGCGGSQGVPYKMELEMWGIFDDSDVFNEIIQDYRRKNPQISQIHYKKVSSDVMEYREMLLEAMATGNGPDIFYFHNSWLPLQKNKVATHPNSANRLVDFKNTFVDVAWDDFVEQDQIYAMPLECDTLALFYNKDLFNQARISRPPMTWDEVVSDVPFLNRYDEQKNITQSTIALGRSKGDGGINRAADILMLMMMQNGVQMADSEGRSVAFDRSYSGNINLGQNSLEYFMRFSNGADKAYSWNSTMDYNIDSFTYGKTAMILNYSYLVQRLRERDPKLNFAVSTAPQLDLDKQVNFANYWGLAVTKEKKIVSLQPGQPTPKYTNDDRAKEAWKFIEYVTMRPQQSGEGVFDPTAKYLENTKKIAARRDLVDKQRSDVTYGAFAQQALTAKSWRQLDHLKTEEIFINMIDDVASGRANSANALRSASERVQVILDKNREY